MKIKRLARWVVLFVVIPLSIPLVGFTAAWQVRTSIASRTPGLVAKSIEFDGHAYRYAVVEPVADRFDGPRPLVVFLHSATECGTDGLLPAIKIPTAFLSHSREQAGAIILLPQFPRHDQGWNPNWHPLILRLIEQTQRDYPVDARRIYLVGMSLGGQGCWHFAAENPYLFAAAVPICGNGSAEALAPRLVAVPVWAFHGSDDSVIPVEGSRTFVAAIKSAGGQKVRFTEYPGVGHLCWDNALSDPELLTWLFSQSRAIEGGRN